MTYTRLNACILKYLTANCPHVILPYVKIPYGDIPYGKMSNGKTPYGAPSISVEPSQPHHSIKHYGSYVKTVFCAKK